MTDKKHQVALKFINKLLNIMDKDSIKKLEDFKDIDRRDLTKQEIDNVMKEMEDELINTFGKPAINYYVKNKIKCYQLTVLKGICKKLGYKLDCKYVDKTEHIDGVGFRRTFVYYSIVKKY